MSGLGHFDTNPDSNLFSAFSLLTHLHLSKGNKIRSWLLKNEIPAMVAEIFQCIKVGSISSPTFSQNHGCSRKSWSKDPKTKLLTLPTWMVSQATKKCLAIIAEKNANHGENYHEVLKKNLRRLRACRKETLMFRALLNARNPHLAHALLQGGIESTPGSLPLQRKLFRGIHASVVCCRSYSLAVQYVWNNSDELNLSPHSKAQGYVLLIVIVAPCRASFLHMSDLLFFFTTIC